jgi:TRAP-type C4-dicarboxylate transport system permease small subunit
LPTPSGELQLFEQHGVPTPAPVPAFRPLHALDKVVGHAEMALLIVLITTMMLLGTSQVVMRELFNTGLPWADPLLRNMVLWAGMVGAMVATQSGRHLNMDAFARLFPVGVRRWVDVLVNLTSAVTCGVLVWVSIPYIQDEISAGSEAIVGALLPWHVQLIFPISFAVMAFRFGLFMLDGIAGGKPQSHQIPVSEIAGLPEQSGARLGAVRDSEVGDRQHTPESLRQGQP